LPEETRAIIDRVSLGGSKKSIRALKDGVFEIKINYGPGWRVYFAEENSSIILLLLGGDKSSQEKDIQLAKKFWRAYAQK
jgi:putative addiction module killer protein